MAITGSNDQHGVREMAPAAERPDKAMALRLIDDLGKVVSETPKVVDATIFLLEQNMYLVDQVEAMPERTAGVIMARLNGQVRTAVTTGLKEHEERCAELRAEEAEELAEHECDNADVSTPKKMLGYLVKHNAYVFGAVVIAAMFLFREPFNLLLMKFVP